jgi:hypothetical protein
LIELDNNLLIKDTFGWDIALFIQLIEPKTMNQRNDILTQLLFFGGTQFFCVNPLIPRRSGSSNLEFGCEVIKVWPRNYFIHKSNSGFF